MQARLCRVLWKHGHRAIDPALFGGREEDAGETDFIQFNRSICCALPFTDADSIPSAKLLISAAVTRWKKRKTARVPERLSDRVLDDIGVSWGEIPSVVHEIFVDDIRSTSFLVGDAATAGPRQTQRRRLHPVGIAFSGVCAQEQEMR